LNLPVTTATSLNESEFDIPEKVKQSLMRTVFKNLEEHEAIAAYWLAKRRKLDVEARQIYFIPYKSKNNERTVIPQTSIEGLRLIAARTGNYGGQINPRLTVRLKDGSKKVVDHEEYDPKETLELISATIEIINKDFSQPQKATALLKSYAQTYNGQFQGLWATKTDIMLLKCAESLALRKAFPEEVGGIYSHEEMDQAKNDIDAVNVSYSTIETTQKPIPEPVSLPTASAEPTELKTPEPPTINIPKEDVQVKPIEPVEPAPEDSQTPKEVFAEIDHEKFVNDTWAKFTRFCADRCSDTNKAVELVKKAVRDRFKVEDPAKISPDHNADLSLYLRTACVPLLQQNGLV
jgi:phage recombination protein Bet